MAKEFKVIWSTQAELDLQEILQFGLIKINHRLFRLN